MFSSSALFVALVLSGLLCLESPLPSAQLQLPAHFNSRNPASNDRLPMAHFMEHQASQPVKGPDQSISLLFLGQRIVAGAAWHGT